MNKQLKIISSLLLLFLLVIPSVALAQAAVGKFTYVEGRVDVLRPPATQAVPVKMGDAVFVGDIIRAKSNSKAEITFSEGNIVRVAPGTRVEISEYMFEETKGKGILKLSRGKVQAIIPENIAKRIAAFGEANRFEIHTPTAIAGARGCNFIVFFQRNWSGVLVIDGTVQAYNPEFPDVVQTVTAGNISIIPQDQPAQPSRPATDAEMKGYVIDTPAPPDTGAPAPPLPAPPPPPSPETPPITEIEGTDTKPPVIKITGPPSLSNLPVSTFNVTSDETVTFKYIIDNKIVIISPNTTKDHFDIPGLADGSHIVTVIATDQAGNSSTVTFTWTVDTTKPFVKTTPESPYGKTTAEIGFNEIVNYKYIFDKGDPISGKGSSIVIKNLGEGTHEIEIISVTDLAGNSMIEPYDYSWINDYGPPVISLKPVAASPEEGTSATVSIELESSEPVTYSYSLNGGGWTGLDLSLIIQNVPEGNNILEVQATDLAGNPSSIEQLSFDLSRYSLTGNFYGCIAGVYGEASGEVAGILNEDWGGWDIQMSGSGGYPNPTWTVTAGGRSSDNIESNNNGYWLLIADGSTDYGLQTLLGTSTLKYLSHDRLGLGEGILSGSYFEGESYEYTLEDKGSGTYTEKPLAFGGRTNGNFVFWDGEDLSRDGMMAGLVGGTDSLWSGSPSFLSLGKYENLNNRTLWAMDIGSEGTSGWTSDGGAFLGSIGGIALNDNLEDMAIGIYIKDTGETGYIYSNNISGSLYPGIEMYELDGNLTAVSMGTTTVLPSELYWDSSSIDFSEEDYGAIVGDITGYIDIESANLVDQNWGVWRAGSGGTYSNIPPADWKSVAGRIIYDSKGMDYWLANMTGTDWSGGRLKGTLSGKFLNIDTMGTFSGDLLGTYNTSDNTWQALSAGIWTEKPLTFVSPMYSDIYRAIEDEGIWLEYTGYMEGLMGGTDSLWSGSGTPVTIMGKYYHDGGSIWYSDIYSSNYHEENYITYDGGAYAGFMGGIDVPSAVSWKNELAGKLVALYVDPDGNAGYLTGYLTGAAYPGINMFEMDGEIARTQVIENIGIEPENLYDSVWYGSGYGSLSGLIGTDGWVKDVTEALYLETMSIVDYENKIAQPWGIYKFTDCGDFSNPSGATLWAAKAGGWGTFGAYTYSDGESSYLCDDCGYWLANITDGIWGTNKLTGTIYGRFLTYTKLGTIEGDLLGTYNDDNTWQAVSLGTWSGEPLTFSGYWDYDTLYYNNEGNVEFGGYDTGLIGSITSSWTGPADFLVMGEYYHYGEPASAYIWNSPIYSYDAIEDDWTTIDGGAFSGYTGGIWKGGTMDGVAVALYVDPEGNAGYLTGNVSGHYYPGIEMWMADGQLTPTQKATGLDPESFQTGWSYLDAHLAGNFDGSGSVEGWTGGDYAYGETLFFVKDDKGLPWGIYNLKLGYGNTFSNKPADTTNWSAMIGGQGTFDYEGYSGYWLAEVEGIWSDDGEIRGNLLNGKYLTPIQMGNIGGPFFGINDASGTWIGESIGTWSGEALAFSGGIGSEFFEWDPFYYLVGNRALIGLMGGTESLWTGTSSFLSLGTYDTESLFNGALWGVDVNTNVSGDWTLYGNAILGYTGGIVKDDSLEGLLAGIFIKDNGETGYIYSDNVTGNLYPGIGMYKINGNLIAVTMGTTTVLPSQLYWGSKSLENDELSFDIAGGINGEMSGIVIKLEEADPKAHLPWGIGRFTATGSYTDEPEGEWNAVSGSVGEHGYKIFHFTEGSWSSGKLSANITLRHIHISPDNANTVVGIGSMLGTYDVDTWRAVCAGYYTAKDLVFGGGLGNEPFEWDTTYYLVGVRSLTGLIGVTESLWTGSPSFLSLGTYDTDYLYDGALWGVDVSTNIPGGFISEGGALLGVTGGIVLGDNEIRDSLLGGLRAIYIKPTEAEGYEAGYIVSSNVSGYVYPDFGMYEMDGNLTAVSMGTTSVLPDNLNWDGLYGDSPSLYIGKDVGTIEGDVEGSVGMQNISIVDQPWGIWWGSGVGTYNPGEPPSTNWIADASGESYDMDWNLVGYWGGKTTGTEWADGVLKGSNLGYWANTLPATGISVGETLGTFDPNLYTWQAVSMGVWLETTKFLEMTQSPAGIAKLNQLNIPCVEVGRVNLSGSNTTPQYSMSVNMNDVIFFAPNTGGQPSIWATNSVGGTYTGNPNQAQIHLAGSGGFDANFHVQQWDTNNNVWLSRIQNGHGTLNRVDVPGTVTINNFQGAAAGTINQEMRTFSGTGAGVAK
jgi:hypothetical protein